MKKITSLTTQQKSRFQEFADKWTKIGLCTDPANRSQAEKAIHLMYECGGINPPKEIIWFDSPYAQSLEYHNKLKKNNNSVRNSVRNSVLGSVFNSVWNSVRNSVVNSVRDSVRNSVWNSVRNSVRNSVMNSVLNSVVNSVYNSVMNSVGNSVYNSVWSSVWGQHEAGWLSYYDYFREVCNLKEETNKLQGLFLLAKSAGWAIPCEKICLVSERHNTLKRDERGRLHSLNSPALTYPDGFSIYAVHGVRVDEWLIKEPHKITARKISRAKNAEIRRVMIEIYGFDRYLKDGNFTLEQQDDFGKLYRKQVKGEPDMVFVRVVNATPELDGSYKEYVLPCRSTCKSAHQAVAESFGLTVETYNPILET